MSTKSNRKLAGEPDQNRRLSIRAIDKKPLAGSLVLHVVVLVLLLASWRSTEKVKTVQLPANIQARVLSAEELKALRLKRQQAEKKIANKKKKLAEIKAKKKRKKAEAKRKKVEKRKKEEARKKALIRDKKLKQEKKRKAKEKKAQEEKNRKKELEANRQEKEKTKKQSERERRLFEKMQEIESRERQLKNQLEADRQARTLAHEQQVALEIELSETERFLSLIRSRIENRWHIPPNSRKLNVVLRINLLPTGELAKVKVLESSGQQAMDQSALSAVRSVSVFPVPDNKDIFEKYFRQFSMSFSPEL